MNEKVSIIIPNYNASKFIEKCIDSVEKQSYKNIEIIIIDDGSTDNSWEIIEKIVEKNNKIIAKRQNNMNASIARNKGIENATGKYALFLDSDDELFEESISELVKAIEKDDADMAMGNMTIIDEEGELVQKSKIIEKTEFCLKPLDYITSAPAPSNKLYRIDFMKKNNLAFANVRIAQDLNFFLKYLSNCKNIALVNKDIYKWRIVGNSMSHSVNFKILDIVESFKNTKKYYIDNNKEDLYREYVQVIEYANYHIQMEKQKKFKTRRERRVVVDYFKIHLKSLDIKDKILFDKYKKLYLKTELKLMLEPIYISKIYSGLSKQIEKFKKSVK